MQRKAVGFRVRKTKHLNGHYALACSISRYDAGPVAADPPFVAASSRTVARFMAALAASQSASVAFAPGILDLARSSAACALDLSISAVRSDASANTITRWGRTSPYPPITVSERLSLPFR